MPSDRHAAVWGRFSAVRRQQRWRVLDHRHAEALANMVELTAFARSDDYVRLHGLITQHGHERVARYQNGLRRLLGEADELEVETGLIWRIGDEEHTRRRLIAAGVPGEQATDVASSCYSHMFWLLLRDIDRAGPAVDVESPEDFALLIKTGTVREWRATLALVAHAPWSPRAEQLATLADEAGLPVVAGSLRECRRVYQLRLEDVDRATVAKEVRRRVALSGMSQRQFAAYVGTSPSRLSTYINGRVVPSAAMLLRIQRASRVLYERAQAGPHA